uniref:Uncharacterized protein n=1 Tax=Steinernema glaseri TaxID=37863 RepID=A0A1I7Z841_9BILA
MYDQHGHCDPNQPKYHLIGANRGQQGTPKTASKTQVDEEPLRWRRHHQNRRKLRTRPPAPPPPLSYQSGTPNALAPGQRTISPEASSPPALVSETAADGDDKFAVNRRGLCWHVAAPSEQKSDATGRLGYRWWDCGGNTPGLKEIPEKEHCAMGKLPLNKAQKSEKTKNRADTDEEQNKARALHTKRYLYAFPVKKEVKTKGEAYVLRPY